jgi:thymidylate synthase (FAD)
MEGKCVRQWPEIERYVADKVRLGHESLLEHASATFFIEGISRVCSHQLVRHRLASYSQRSERYCDESSVDYVVPESIASDEECRKLWLELALHSIDVYEKFREKGINKEDARFALLQASDTKITVTMNFRAWRHFIEMRAAPAAQWEIRGVAMAVLKELYELSPGAFQDLKEKYNG